MGEVEGGAFFFIRTAVFFQLCCIWCVLTPPADTGIHRSGWVLMVKKKCVDINEALRFHAGLGIAGALYVTPVLHDL